MKMKIILTDYPKAKHIEANYRGVETEELVKIKDRMFHCMMMCEFIEAGGYIIRYDSNGVEAELKWRRNE